MKEAKRILKPTGTIYIAELESRTNEAVFLNLMRLLGFRRKSLKTGKNKVFLFFRFGKRPEKKVSEDENKKITKKIKSQAKKALLVSKYKKR